MFRKPRLKEGKAINIRASIIYSLAIGITILLGLLSRSSFVAPSSFVHLYVGDALWACLIYWGVCFLRPSLQVAAQALFALVFCFCIEFSQLYQAQWINDIRHTTLGGLILGFGFKVSDLFAYLIGVLLGAYLNICLVKKQLG
ncbi:DUF2809 domain-containing protein [Glaciecola sp. XM2]|uniref:ribosomal maturation YjgA family protein n=1 Tax=Glaciecola sp. XM2 TaxID=1914931 RepID=UPI001BDEB34D|nr:DUF2809 domain-containing protein [Glaciecola sp. XM2]